VTEMSFKSGVKGRGSDKWWERRWWLWWGDTDMCRMRWTRRTVSEQNEVDGMKKGADSTGKVVHMWKSGWWFVMRKYGWLWLWFYRRFFSGPPLVCLFVYVRRIAQNP